MPTYEIAGISVQFPHNAYDCQLVYMERVIRALQQGANALLESPTGTGKTLCLLCATLAWRQSVAAAAAGGPPSQGRSRVVILYASRTHSQLHQVIRELKATAYRPRMVVLASREQMCIHEDVRGLRGGTQNRACRALVKDRKCAHQNCVADFAKSHRDIGKEQPVDIEDLVRVGKAHGPCPYYLSRELHSEADILFLPYNYLIEGENRRSLTGINWDRVVLIFDEAHNLEGICAEAASFDLPAAHLTGCIGEAKLCVELAAAHGVTADNASAADVENFALLKALLLELERRINEIPLDSGEAGGFTRPGAFMYEFLAGMKITWETAAMLTDVIERAAGVLEDEAANARRAAPASRLLALRDALKLTFRGSPAETASHSAYYKVHVQEARDGDRGGAATVPKAPAKVSRTLSWWCFNPGVAMEEFGRLGVRCVILTSGTLAPLESFACELKLPFDVRLENPHVIDSSQIWVGVVPSGPSGRPLNSSYKTRDSPQYKQELGNTIVNFARIVPDGLLVFFPSYHLLNSCIDAWQCVAPGAAVSSSTVWERICKFKQAVVEPRESALFNQANESYMAKLADASSSGAVFFAVCRGKVSEGLDFADRSGRAVVVTGIPYAMKTDPKVRLKREYLDEACRSNKRGIRGEEWYVQQAARAVNQAVGRVIRHRSDYGAIILCDERFAQGNFQSQMSLWLRPHVKCYSKFGDATFTLTRFFRDAKVSSLPAPVAPQLLPQPLGRTHAMRPATEQVGNLLGISYPGMKSSELDERLDPGRGSGGIGRPSGSFATGQMMGPPRSSMLSSQTSSELLAPGQAHTGGDRPLDSLSIIQANYAVGTVPGFPVDKSGIRLQQRDADVSLAQGKRKSGGSCATKANVTSMSTSEEMMTKLPGVAHAENAKVQTLSVCSTTATEEMCAANLSKRRQLEPAENARSLNEPVTTDDSVVIPIGSASLSTRKRDSGGQETRDDDDGSKERILVPDSAMRRHMTARASGEIDRKTDDPSPCTSQSAEQGPCPPTVARDRCPASLGSASSASTSSKSTRSSQKTKNAAGFLREVKAHLSLVEYARFLDCMKGLKSQVLTMTTLLESVSNLFSAPERLFLLRRFGDFIPSQHRQLFEERLAAKCAELGCPFVEVNNNCQTEIDAFGDPIRRSGSSLRPRSTSRDERKPAKT